MRTITHTSPESLTSQGRGKAQSRATNNFRQINKAQAKNKTQVMSKDSYLFKQESVKAPQPKLFLRSREQLKRILIQKRSAFLLAKRNSKYSFRSTQVMSLIKSLVDSLKTRMITKEEPSPKEEFPKQA